MGHEERDHALLSASSAHRWLKCTKSARLEEQFPDTTSEAAKEGTLQMIQRKEETDGDRYYASVLFYSYEQRLANLYLCVAVIKEEE